jgi:hypothetical protein
MHLSETAKVCPRCGYADPISLIRVDSAWLRRHNVPRTLFEDDHCVGRNHDREFVAAICRNCHGEITELRLLAGIGMEFEPDPGEREVLRLRGLALLLKDSGCALEKWIAEKQGARKDNDAPNNLAGSCRTQEGTKAAKTKEEAKRRT